MAMSAGEMGGEHKPGLYRSGVAARLAGVPVDTLRVWERRYAVVGPSKSPGRQRLYSDADIERLTLIKRLVDSGHPIGDLAGLSDSALRGIRSLGAAVSAHPAAAPPADVARSANKIRAGIEARVALVGWLVAAKPIVDGLAAGSIDVVSSCNDPFSAAGVLAGAKADIVVIELPTLQEPDVELVDAIRTACHAETSVVMYRFARTPVLRRLRLAGHTVVRAAADVAEIEAICLRALHPAGALRARAVTDRVEAPPPKFDEQTLAGLAAASRTVDCECPKHLVNLVMDLVSFERYSAQCASRSPADHELHLDLQLAAGRARAIIELALERVAIAEGFALPAAGGQ